MTKACFLDRDGVVIVEKNYLCDINDIELEQGCAEAIAMLNKKGILAVVVSNQSGVARGYFDENKVEQVNRHIDELLAVAGAHVDGWYYCPHHPKGSIDNYAVDCDCRKPAPGMLFQAARELGIDVSASCMIGDKFSDIECAANAGCARAVMVRTGHGASELGKKTPDGVTVADNILEAVKVLVSES